MEQWLVWSNVLNRFFNSNAVIGEIALALAAFVPAVLYVVWIRNTERYNREPWGAIFAAFVWGATVAVAISLLLEIVFSVPFSRAFPWDARIGAAIVLRDNCACGDFGPADSAHVPLAFLALEFHFL